MKKPWYKRWKAWGGIFAVIFVIGLFAPEEVEPEVAAEVEKPKEVAKAKAPVVAVKSPEEIAAEAEDAKRIAETAKENEAKAAEATKVKADADAKAKVAADAKKAADLANEKPYYIDVIAPQLDGVMETYDAIWANHWSPTFNAIAGGDFDFIKAQKSMQNVEQAYMALYKEISALGSGKLSEANEELHSTFVEKLRDASNTRSIAAIDARSMFSAGTFKQAEIDGIMATVDKADKEMMQAIIARAQIELNLGITEE